MLHRHLLQVAPICSGRDPLALPTTSIEGITGTWAPALNNTATTTYTFTPGVGQCATTATLTITVNPNVTPTFAAVAAICSGDPLSPALPTTSINGITGTWAPAMNNTATTTYTFTPDVGQCATTATLTITVNPNVTPTFTAGRCYLFWCDPLAALPTTSIKASPVHGLLQSTILQQLLIHLLRHAGQCATTATMTITVNPNVTPTFAAVAAYLFRSVIPGHCQQLLLKASPVHGLLHSIILQQLLIHLLLMRTMCNNSNVDYHC